jgi:hypothetical protein
MNHRLVLVAVVIVALAVLVMSLAAPRVSEQAFAYASRPQPMSPAQLVLESRQVAPSVAERGLGGAGWLALVLVAVGAAVLVLRYGSEALRQWRLVRGRTARPYSPHPTIPTLSAHDYPALPVVRNIPTPPQLPGGQHEG